MQFCTGILIPLFIFLLFPAISKTWSYKIKVCVSKPFPNIIELVFTKKLFLVICSWYCIIAISTSVTYFRTKTKDIFIKKSFSLSVSYARLYCEPIMVRIFASYHLYCSSFQIMPLPSVVKFYTKTNRYIWEKTFCFGMKNMSVWTNQLE